MFSDGGSENNMAVSPSRDPSGARTPSGSPPEGDTLDDTVTAPGDVTTTPAPGLATIQIFIYMLKQNMLGVSCTLVAIQ